MAPVQICGEVCAAYAAEPGPHGAGGGARAPGCRRPGILALPGTLIHRAGLNTLYSVVNHHFLILIRILNWSSLLNEGPFNGHWGTLYQR